MVVSGLHFQQLTDLKELTNAYGQEFEQGYCAQGGFGAKY